MAAACDTPRNSKLNARKDCYMEKILYIDSCTRPDPASRSATLGRAFLDEYCALHSDAVIERVVLRNLDLRPYGIDEVTARVDHIVRKEFDVPMFALARQFADADKIVISAPFWDCSFPSMLKIYFEHICVQDVTFGYDATGQIGLCRASALAYITTSGGRYDFASGRNVMEMATPAIRAMAAMYGIPRCQFTVAEGLDIDGNDPVRIMEEALATARNHAGEF
jgi:FMN-dependent NADH-azoreductase